MEPFAAEGERAARAGRGIPPSRRMQGRECRVGRSVARLASAPRHRSAQERGLALSGQYAWAGSKLAARFCLDRRTQALGGLVATHHLKAVARACEARTGFGIVASTTVGAGNSSVVATGLGNQARSAIQTDHRSTRESGCATTCLTGPKIRGSLGLANVAGREDY